MSSYDTPEALRANYEAIRESEGWSWEQLHAELTKQLPADDKTLLPWAAGKARAEAASADAEGAAAGAPKGRTSSKAGASTAAADDEIGG